MKKIFLFTLLFSLFFIFYSKADYSSEQKAAYTWAFNNGITTMSTIDKADMNGEVTRIALAKMISNYAIKTLKKKGDTTKKCVFTDVTSDLDKQYDKGVTNACQLGLMGQGIIKFRPYDKVTRAEFGTILSRLLYGDKYNGGNPYYQKHLNQLKSEGIISNISYADKRNESRGNVMIMLKRSKEGGVKTSTNKNSIPNFDEFEHDTTISCHYEELYSDDEYDAFLKKKEMILPYKDGYFGYDFHGQDGYGFYIYYRLSNNMCDVYISSDSIFRIPGHGGHDFYNKLYYHDGNYFYDENPEIVKTLNCNPNDSEGCLKEAEKYAYNLLIGAETNEYFSFWMDELKRRIDNHQVKTVTEYYQYAYDERSSLYFQCRDETINDFHTKNPDKGGSNCVNRLAEKYCRYKYINACSNGFNCEKIKSEMNKCNDF